MCVNNLGEKEAEMFFRTNSWELLGSLITTSEFEFTFNLFRETTFAANSVFSRIH